MSLKYIGELSVSRGKGNFTKRIHFEKFDGRSVLSCQCAKGRLEINCAKGIPHSRTKASSVPAKNSNDKAMVKILTQVNKARSATGFSPR